MMCDYCLMFQDSALSRPACRHLLQEETPLFLVSFNVCSSMGEIQFVTHLMVFVEENYICDVVGCTIFIEATFFIVIHGFLVEYLLSATIFICGFFDCMFVYVCKIFFCTIYYPGGGGGNFSAPSCSQTKVAATC